MSLDTLDRKENRVIPKEIIDSFDQERITLFYRGLFGDSIIIDGYQFYIIPISAFNKSRYFREISEL